MAPALFIMNKCLPFTKICSPLPPHSQGKSVLPLLCLGSSEEPNREREFPSPFTAGRVVEAFSPKQKNILYCHFYSRLCLETEQSYSSVLLLTRRKARSRALCRSSGRLQTGGSDFSGPTELAPAGRGAGSCCSGRWPQRGTKASRLGRRGGRGPPRAGCCASPGSCGEGAEGLPAAAVPGRSCSDLAERRAGGRAGAGEGRGLLAAPAAGVCRLPARRFEARSCRPPPRGVASRRVAAVEPGEEQRQPRAAFGRLPGGREERSGIRLRVFLGKFLVSPHPAVGCCPPSPSSLRVPQPPANFFCAYLF